MLKRRGFFGGLLAAPLIVRPGVLMPVSAQLLKVKPEPQWFLVQGYLGSENHCFLVLRRFDDPRSFTFTDETLMEKSEAMRYLDIPSQYSDLFGTRPV